MLKGRQMRFVALIVTSWRRLSWEDQVIWVHKCFQLGDLSLNEGILSIANFMPDFPASTTNCEMETKQALISFALHTLIYILYHIIFVTAQYCKKHLQKNYFHTLKAEAMPFEKVWLHFILWIAVHKYSWSPIGIATSLSLKAMTTQFKFSKKSLERS